MLMGELYGERITMIKYCHSILSAAIPRFRLLLCLLLTFALSLSLTGCLFKNGGEPDRLSSWGHINQIVSRAADWQRIVENSSFQLGEKKLEESWIGGDGKRINDYSISYGSYPHIDGSTVSIPMAVEFARQHLNLTDEDARSFVSFNTTPHAYEYLITKETDSGYGWIESQDAHLEDDHAADLIIVTEPSRQDLDLAKQNNVELVVKPVACDAFVFITHINNPVDSLTLEQVRDIYSGKITNWLEVGGNNEPIVAYQREEESGSQTTMLSLVMKETAMLPPETVTVIHGMGSLIDAVAEYQNHKSSIGYTFRYYIDNLYKNPDIKILKIDGVSSDAENLRSETYPLTTPYFGVIRASDVDKTGGLFLDWMLTDEGQRCIQQAGYVPVREV